MERGRFSLIIVILASLLAVSLCGCCCGTRPQAEPRITADFSNAAPVAILGYDGDAMEPFLTRDGALLLFNNRNDPGTDTNLYYARKINDTAFRYEGEIDGANSGALDGVASMDLQQDLYFTSTRSYASTLSTIYTGRYEAGQAAGVTLVEGISKKQAPWLNMDSEISADGRRLYYTENEFDPGAGLPKTSDLKVAERTGPAAFRQLPDSDELLRNVNSGLLEYAPCTSADELELFFTRASIADRAFKIMRAKRNSTSEPFGEPETLITGGLVEAPTISPDGNCLYYHTLDNGTYQIYLVRRVATTP